MATVRMISTEIGNRALVVCFEAVKRLFCFQRSLPLDRLEKNQKKRCYSSGQT